MILFAKKKMITTAEILHRRIFGQEMSMEMRKFLGHLSWSFFGGIIASGIMFLINVLAARWLGINGFGIYNALLSFATSLGFFFLMGSDVSSVRFLADKQYKQRHKNILTSSLAIVSIQMIVVIAILFIFRGYVLGKLAIKEELYLIGICWGAIIVYKNLFDGYLRSFMLIKKQSIIRIFDALVVAVVFFFLYFLHKKMIYSYYIYAIIAGNALFIIAGFLTIAKKIGKIHWQDVLLLFRYNKFVIIASVGGFLMSLEKLAIGKFIGITELGMFSIYYTASFLVLANIGGIFMNVFLPSIIKEKENMKAVVRKLNILFVKIFPFWFVVSSPLTYIIVSFAGKTYPIRISFLIFFPISAYATFMFSIMISILKIEYIKKASVIALICYALMIFTIFIVRNIEIYIFIQSILYMLFYVGLVQYFFNTKTRSKNIF